MLLIVIILKRNYIGCVNIQYLNPSIMLLIVIILNETT